MGAGTLRNVTFTRFSKNEPYRKNLKSFIAYLSFKKEQDRSYFGPKITAEQHKIDIRNIYPDYMFDEQNRIIFTCFLLLVGQKKKDRELKKVLNTFGYLN